MGLGTEEILVLISIALSLVVLFLVSRKQAETLLKRYLVLSILFLPIYVNLKLFLHPVEMMSSFGIFDMWIRHIFFYFGQFYLFMFVIHLFHLIAKKEIPETNMEIPYKKIGAFLVAFSVSIFLVAYQSLQFSDTPFTPFNFLYFITERGVQHIMALIFFFLTIATMRTYSLYPSYKLIRGFLMWFFIANCFFILLHIFEYLKETLGYFPNISEELGENLESFFQYIGLTLFYFSILKLFKIEQIKSFIKKDA